MAAIELENCSLHLPVFGLNNRSLKGRMLSTMTGGRLAPSSGTVPVVEALNEVTLSVKPGDRLGLVGHNGAGKTTLLKLIAGIYEPTSGIIKTKGRVANLLDVTMGLDYEATGEENIVIKGLLHGLSKREIRALAPEIGEFSGLGDYLKLPVRIYSSGMVVRLAFAIATSLQADILIMDEWLGVGDADFAARSEERLRNLVDKASILVIASHNEHLIDALCTRKAHMAHGRLERLS